MVQDWFVQAADLWQLYWRHRGCQLLQLPRPSQQQPQVRAPVSMSMEVHLLSQSWSSQAQLGYLNILWELVPMVPGHRTHHRQ